MTDQFADLKAELEDLQKRMNERGREAFKKGVQEIFETYPEIESFSWTQYTPYFNDGDPCVFGVHTWADVKLKSDDEEIEEGGSAYGEYGEIETLLSVIPENVMEDLFGDHVRVIVSRDNIEVEEYEHD